MAHSKIDKRDLVNSGFFDADWYSSEYPDVEMLGMDPLEHFLWLGARLKRNPGPAFDSRAYLETYSDVARANYNPVLHFMRYGDKEGRRAFPVRPAPISLGGADQASRLPVDRLPGYLSRIPGRPTVMLCAHVIGNELFGSERSLLDIVEALHALQLNVVVTLPGQGNKQYLDTLRTKTIAVFILPYKWWRDRCELNYTSVAGFAKIIAEERVDVVHANTIMIREPLVAADMMGVKRVIHSRELIMHDQHLVELIGESAEDIVTEVWRHCDVLIANSEATKAGFARRGKTPVVVPNTADVDILSSVATPGINGTLRVGLISSNLPKKGIWEFVELAQLVAMSNPEIEFCLIGPTNVHTEEISRKIRARELPGNIHVLGYRDTPFNAISETDIVLSISLFQESFGRTVLEAMAAGRPAIVFDHGAPPEIVEDGVSGFVVPFGDLQQIVDRLRELSKDREKLIMLGRAAQDRAKSVFGRQAFLERMQAAYDKILSTGFIEPRRIVLPARRDLRPTPREKLRIAYFVWHFPVPSETFVLNELRQLVASGHDVTVFCKQSPYPDFQPDFEITWQRVKDSQDLAEQLVATDRNIVHSHFVYPTVTEMVWPACEKAGCDFTFITHAQDIFRYRNDAVNRIGEVGRSERCRMVFVPSHFHRSYLADRGVPEDRMMINPNGCDHPLYADGWVYERKTRPFRTITAIHRFTEKKGLINLIRAAKLLKEDDIKIELYGYGDLEDSYKTEIIEGNISNVELCGPVKGREEMLEVFRKSDLFACPSVRAADGDMDGIPTVLMEAMAAGVPVLTTDLSGIPDLVCDGITGFVTEASPEAIAEKIREFYALPDAAIDAVIQDASALIKQKYNSATLVDGLLRVWTGETVDLVIVSWNNLPESREILSRLYTYTSLPFHLIICDNGSEHEKVAHLLAIYAAHDNFTLVLNRENAFVGPATNICLDEGWSDYAIYICGKEGMTTKYGWEKNFVDYMNANPDVGQAGTLCYSPSYLHGQDYPKGVPVFEDFRNKAFASDNPDRTFSHVQGGFFVVRRAMYDKIGGFSTDVPHNYTDVEFSYYVESCGWKLGEVPGLMALFNKTRPSLIHRIDETHCALHPPMLQDLPVLDKIANGQVRHCNICGEQSESFEGGDVGAICLSCGSTRRARSIHRVLAESILLYRRLPALGVNVPPSLEHFWREQFQGKVMSSDELLGVIKNDGRTEFSARRLSVVLLNDVFTPDRFDEVIASEVSRLLHAGGMLLISGECDLNVAIEKLAPHEFEFVTRKRFSSAVSRYDWAPVLIFSKASS